MNIIFFDLEGPLSPQDNAYNLMKLFPGGDKIFQIISRYDDLLTLEQRPGYEPGDTLALIAPFLVFHRISEQDIINLAAKATTVSGAGELIAHLHREGWSVFCISTSYSQYALEITQRLGIPARNVASTRFPLRELSQQLKEADFKIMRAIESTLLQAGRFNDGWIKKTLDRFYREELPGHVLGDALKQVKPVGGQRKAEALQKFARNSRKKLSRCVAIGDSITDCKMLHAVNQAGGLAIAFNGNEFILPYANVALASTDIGDLGPLLDLWSVNNSMEEVMSWVKIEEKNFARNKNGNFSWMADKKDISAIIELHKKTRRLVRDDAARLG